MDHLDATVHLGLPATPGSIAVVRAVVASVASRLALAYDAVDDLRIAAAEASALLPSSGLEGELPALTSSRAMPTCTSMIWVEGAAAAPELARREGLCRQVLEGLTDVRGRRPGGRRQPGDRAPSADRGTVTDRDPSASRNDPRPS